MTENRFKRKISAIMLSAVIASASLASVLPCSQEALAADNDGTSVSDVTDNDTDTGD